jgi:hypothetical protein
LRQALSTPHRRELDRRRSLAERFQHLVEEDPIGQIERHVNLAILDRAMSISVAIASRLSIGRS